MKLEIYSNGSSQPGSLLTTASNTLPSSTLTTSLSTQRFDFSEPITLTSGTTYWAVWSRTGALDDTNYFGLGGATTTSPDGQLSRIWNGSAWVSTGLLYMFLQTTEAPIPRADGGAYVKLDSNGTIPSVYPSGAQVRIEFVTPYPAGQYQWTVRSGDPSPGSATYGAWATTRYYVISDNITNGSSFNLMF